jgi:transcriptional regulator with XRE-family HTH domain
MPDKETVKRWFEGQYLDWQKREGGRRSVGKFAAYLGVSRATLYNWMLRGQVPDPENVQRIAGKLSETIYDLLERPRPDAYLQAIIANWAKIPEGLRLKLAKEAERYAAEEELDGSAGKTRAGVANAQ